MALPFKKDSKKVLVFAPFLDSFDLQGLIRDRYKSFVQLSPRIELCRNQIILAEDKGLPKFPEYIEECASNDDSDFDEIPEIEEKYQLPYAFPNTALIIKALYESKNRQLDTTDLWLAIRVTSYSPFSSKCDSEIPSL